MSEIRVFGNLRTLMTKPLVAVPGDTVRAALETLCTDQASLRAAILDGDRLHAHVRVLVNGHDIDLMQGLDTPLDDNDQVAIFPPIAGGEETSLE